MLAIIAAKDSFLDGRHGLAKKELLHGSRINVGHRLGVTAENTMKHPGARACGHSRLRLRIVFHLLRESFGWTQWKDFCSGSPQWCKLVAPSGGCEKPHQVW